MYRSLLPVFLFVALGTRVPSTLPRDWTSPVLPQSTCRASSHSEGHLNATIDSAFHIH